MSPEHKDLQNEIASLRAQVTPLQADVTELKVLVATLVESHNALRGSPTYGGAPIGSSVFVNEGADAADPRAGHIEPPKRGRPRKDVAAA